VLPVQYTRCTESVKVAACLSVSIPKPGCLHSDESYCVPRPPANSWKRPVRWTHPDARDQSVGLAAICSMHCLRVAYDHALRKSRTIVV
jgi:hypothetical protein